MAQVKKTISCIAVIKDAQESDLKELAALYKSTFKKHNIFCKSDKEIISYLKEKQSSEKKNGGGFVVAKSGSKIIGGILLKKETEDPKGKHVLWKYNHLAVSPSFKGKGIGKAIINAAEDKIRQMIKSKKIRTSKIEVGVSENEKESIRFYKSLGFYVEGMQKSHYRHKETSYILGKEVSPS